MPSGYFIERLEGRVLMSATTTVTAALADNRGYVNIYFSGPLDGSTVNTNSVRLYTAGPDGQLNTADDIQQPITVSYGGGQDRIIITSNVPLNTAYCILVRGNAVLDASENRIDGEFSGTFPTGNGTVGGNLEFDANVAPINSQVAVFYFNAGAHVNVGLFSNAQLPLSIANFLYYTNNGTYDGTMIHRIANSPGLQIVQGGAFFDWNNPLIGERSIIAPIAQEPVYSNVTGTLAFANTGNPDSTSDEWYFNVGNDSDLDGGYSVFGGIVNAAGLTLLQGIDNIPGGQQLNLSSTVSGGASRYGNPNVVNQLTNVPTTNASVTASTANPATDFIYVHRVAIKNYITAVGAGLPAIATAAKTSAAIFASGMVITPSTAVFAPLATPTTNSALSADPDKLKL